MRGGRGPKSKGANWEREVCRMLSRWLTRDALDDVFWRSSMSGGRATVHRKQGRKTADAAAGDICAIRPEGARFLDVFFVECKAARDIMLEAYLFAGFKGKREDHWHKPRAQARQHGKIPLVIIKRNNLPPMVMVGPDGQSELGRLARERMRALAYFPLFGAAVYELSYVLNVCNPRRL